MCKFLCLILRLYEVCGWGSLRLSESEHLKTQHTSTPVSQLSYKAFALATVKCQPDCITVTADLVYYQSVSLARPCGLCLPIGKSFTATLGLASSLPPNMETHDFLSQTSLIQLAAWTFRRSRTSSLAQTSSIHRQITPTLYIAGRVGRFGKGGHVITFVEHGSVPVGVSGAGRMEMLYRNLAINPTFVETKSV